MDRTGLVCEKSARHLNVTAREKRGNCARCGLKTHNVNWRRKRTPLTVEGKVFRGTCLICNPIEGYIERPAGEATISPPAIIENRSNETDDLSSVTCSIRVQAKNTRMYHNNSSQIKEEADSVDYLTEDGAYGMNSASVIQNDHSMEDKPDPCQDLDECSDALIGDRNISTAAKRALDSNHSISSLFTTDDDVDLMNTSVNNVISISATVNTNNDELNMIDNEPQYFWNNSGQLPQMRDESVKDKVEKPPQLTYNRLSTSCGSNLLSSSSQNNSHIKQKQLHLRSSSLDSDVLPNSRPNERKHVVYNSAFNGAHTDSHNSNYSSHRKNVLSEKSKEDDLHVDNGNSHVAYCRNNTSDNHLKEQPAIISRGRSTELNDGDISGNPKRPILRKEMSESILQTSARPSIISKRGRSTESYSKRSSSFKRPVISNRGRTVISNTDDLHKNSVLSLKISHRESSTGSSKMSSIDENSGEAIDMDALDMTDPYHTHLHKKAWTDSDEEKRSIQGYSYEDGFQLYHDRRRSSNRRTKDGGYSRDIDKRIASTWVRQAPESVARKKKRYLDDNQDCVENEIDASCELQLKHEEKLIEESHRNSLNGDEKEIQYCRELTVISIGHDEKSLSSLLPEESVAGNQSLLDECAEKCDIHTIMGLLNEETCEPKSFSGTLSCLINATRDSSKEITLVLNQCVQIITSKMWEYTDCPKLQARACGALWAIATVSNSGDKISIASAGAIEAILFCAMQMHCSSTEVQEWACGAICSLAHNSEQAVEIATMGAFISVVNVMKAHPKSSLVQKWAIRAIWSLCVDTERNKIDFTLVDAGMSLFKCAMDSHHEDEELQYWGCQLLWCLSTNNTVAGVIIMNGLIDTIIRTIRSFPESQVMYDPVFGALTNLSSITENQLPVTWSTICDVAVWIIGRNPNNAFVQEKSCSVLSQLALKKQYKAAIVCMGGIDAIIMALEKFPDNIGLQEQAHVALFSFSVNCDGCKNAITLQIKKVVNSVFDKSLSACVHRNFCGTISSLAVNVEYHSSIIASGALKAIICATRKYGNISSFSEMACLALLNMSYYSESKDAMIKSGVPKEVIEIMKSVKSVQQDCCDILWNLSAGPAHSVNEIVKAGGVDSVIDAMRRNSEISSIQKVGCSILWIISEKSVQHKSDIVTYGGIDQIMNAVLFNLYDPTVLIRACGALSFLIYSSEIANSFMQAGWIDVMLQLMENNIHDATVLEFGCLVLRNLAAVGTEVDSSSSDVITIIIRAVNEHPLSLRLLKEACGALWSLSLISEHNKNKIISSGGMDILMEALQKKSDDRIEEARDALEILML